MAPRKHETLTEVGERGKEPASYKEKKKGMETAHRLKDLKRYQPTAKYRPYMNPNSNKLQKEKWIIRIVTSGNLNTDGICVY